MKRYYLYEIRNLVTGSVYVGITHDPKTRFAEHFERSSNPHLRNDIGARGAQCFRAAVVQTFSKLSHALAAEIRRIAFLQTREVRLYNLSEGGEHPWSEDVKLQDAHLRALIYKAKHRMRKTREMPDRWKDRLLAPHVPMSHKLKIGAKEIALKEARRVAQNILLAKLFEFVKINLDAAYGGTDRMSPEEQIEWRLARGPILKLGELDWRLEIGPDAWHDHAEWIEAFPRIAPGSLKWDLDPKLGMTRKINPRKAA